eukprot:7386432-Prymnesium_polylepis.1
MDRPLAAAAAAAAAAIATAAMRVGVEVGAAAVLVHAVGALIAAAAARIARIDEQALVDQVCLGLPRVGGAAGAKAAVERGRRRDASRGRRAWLVAALVTARKALIARAVMSESRQTLTTRKKESM